MEDGVNWELSETESWDESCEREEISEVGVGGTREMAEDEILVVVVREREEEEVWLWEG